MSKNILIAGINGFVGKHLAFELFNSGLKVIGVGTDPVLDPEISSLVKKYYQCDLTNIHDVKKIPLNNIDSIINLAGLAQQGSSYGKEDLYININIQVHTVLINEIRKINKGIRILVVSTGAVYDNNQSMPLTEKSKLANTGSPYAISKIKLEKKIIQLIEDGLDIIIARPFNHIGPGQLEGFIVPDLTSKIIGHKKMTIGPLNTFRDYTDVRDVVRAYRMIISKPEKLNKSIYNICSGKTISRDQIIELIKKETKNSQIETEIDNSLMRPNDAPIIFGSSKLLTDEFNWKPTIDIAQTIHDYVLWRMNKDHTRNFI